MRRLQIVWWWSLAFGSGIWPRTEAPVFCRWRVGPVEVRWFRR